MDKGSGGTNMLGQEIYQGRTGRRKGSRVTIRLGMGKQAYIGGGYNSEGIHKNTRRIAGAGHAVRGLRMDTTSLPNLWSGREELVR